MAHKTWMSLILLTGSLATVPALAEDEMPPPECPAAELRTESAQGCEEPPPITCGRVVASPGCHTPDPRPHEEEGEDAGRPDLRPGFLHRVWRFTADVDAFDAEEHVLNVTITRILNLPGRFADQDDHVVDADAYVLFSDTTRVYGTDGGRLARETSYDALLDGAETVRIVGKVVPPRKWELDEDDFPTPSVRAKRVYVTG